MLTWELIRHRQSELDDGASYSQQLTVRMLRFQMHLLRAQFRSSYAPA